MTDRCIGVPVNLVLAAVRASPASATLVRKPRAGVDHVEGLAEVAGQRAGGGNRGRAWLDLDGAIYLVPKMLFLLDARETPRR